MLATLVTYKRPKWAADIAAHLVDEPGVDFTAVRDNSPFTDLEGAEAWGVCFQRWISKRMEWGRDAFAYPVDVALIGAFPAYFSESVQTMQSAYGSPPKMAHHFTGPNLGAGGGRNELLRIRRQGEAFIRADDDFLPKEHGWLEAAMALLRRPKGPAIVRLEDKLPKGHTRRRALDAHGPIWVVRGEVADALGFFYQGFGRTLLDDLEYSRRAMEWSARRSGKLAGIVDLGWPMRDLCSEKGLPGSPWLAPRDLWMARCRTIARRKFDLYVPLDQPEPGWEQRDAGQPDRETHDGIGVRWT